MNNLSSSLTSRSVFNEFVKKALGIKYLYISCLVIFTGIAFFTNKYSKTIYEVHSSILLNQNKNASLNNNNEMFHNLEVLQNNTNLENEVNNMSSFPLVSATLVELNFEVKYFKEKDGFIKETKEIYLESPYVVSLDKSHIQAIDVPFYITYVSDSSFRLTAKSKNASLYNYVDNEVVNHDAINCNEVYRFNQPVTTDKFKFSVSYNHKWIDKSKNNSYFFVLSHLDYITMQYLGRLKIEPLSTLATVINISFKGENVPKSTVFLNKYIENYLQNNLQKKNNVALSTINFIDSQMTQVSDSLVSAESSLRDYRSANQVLDLSFQGQKIFDQMAALESEKSNMLVQKRYYNYIIDYFNKNAESKDLNPPSQSNVVDPILNQLISEMLTLNKERSGILNNSQKSLFINEVENKIKRQKEAIIENVKNNLNTLNLSLNELDYRSNKLSQEVSKLPKTELRLIGMERKFKLNNEIYNFFIQKRAEAQITKASNIPDYEIIEPARNMTASIIAPKKSLNYLIAILLGLFLPSIFIFGRDMFDDRVKTAYEVEHITGHKVIGEIFRNKHKVESVVLDKPRSSVSESFRTLRTNLFIKLKVDEHKTVLVTSSLPREGKTFLSFNLASSIALLGHKTIVIDCDLRRPSLHTRFKTDNSIGLSTYLSGRAVMEDVIMKLGPNLYFIPAGPVLPNPAELIESKTFEKLINQLKSTFTYLLIDTPPLGAVADSFLIMKYVSSSIIVTRYNYTKKEILLGVLKQLKTNNYENFNFVFNDVNFNKTGYGSYYGKYYSDEK